jgi:hypothetical protein
VSRGCTPLKNSGSTPLGQRIARGKPFEGFRPQLQCGGHLDFAQHLCAPVRAEPRPAWSVGFSALRAQFGGTLPRRNASVPPKAV